MLGWAWNCVDCLESCELLHGKPGDSWTFRMLREHDFDLIFDSSSLHWRGGSCGKKPGRRRLNYQARTVHSRTVHAASFWFFSGRLRVLSRESTFFSADGLPALLIMFLVCLRKMCFPLQQALRNPCAYWSAILHEHFPKRSFITTLPFHKRPI